jgi:hypothetical protein
MDMAADPRPVFASVAVVALAPFMLVAGAQNAAPYGQPSTAKGDWPMFFPW